MPNTSIAVVSLAKIERYLNDSSPRVFVETDSALSGLNVAARQAIKLKTNGTPPKDRDALVRLAVLYDHIISRIFYSSTYGKSKNTAREKVAERHRYQTKIIDYMSRLINDDRGAWLREYFQVIKLAEHGQVQSYVRIMFEYWEEHKNNAPESFRRAYNLMLIMFEGAINKQGETDPGLAEALIRTFGKYL